MKRWNTRIMKTLYHSKLFYLRSMANHKKIHNTNRCVVFQNVASRIDRWFGWDNCQLDAQRWKISAIFKNLLVTPTTVTSLERNQICEASFSIIGIKAVMVSLKKKLMTQKGLIFQEEKKNKSLTFFWLFFQLFGKKFLYWFIGDQHFTFVRGTKTITNKTAE